MDTYDTWKLDNNEPDKYDCEICGDLFDSEDLEEVTYYDADRDKQCHFMCIKCMEEI